MCVVFVKRNADKLLVALNRDEYYGRPTQPLSYIEDKRAYAGVDLRFGGTWFVVDKIGRFALVTNIRNKYLAGPDRPTRGELPFLAVSGDEDFLDDAKKYNPFNLLWGNRSRICYYNNVDDKESIVEEDLFSLSNGRLPCAWPKSFEGKKQFKHLDLAWDDERIFDKSFAILSSREEYDFVAPDTGFSEELEKKLTPIFVSMPEYGTVSSTVMLAGADGIRVEERRWPSGDHSKFIIRPH